MRNGIGILTTVILCTFVMAGCNALKTNTEDETTSNEEYCEQATVYAMDTVMTLDIYGDEVLAKSVISACKKKIEILDNELSAEKDNNELGLLNEYGIGTLNRDCCELFLLARDCYYQTDGAFNPLIRPLVSAWGFNTKNYRVPEQKEIKKLLKLTNMSDVDYREPGNIMFNKEGMSIDLGGIAKGYTSAKLIEDLKSYGIKSAMVNLGGNVQVLGSKPDGSRWKVAIKNPNSEENYLGIMNVTDRAIVTSGSYERYFEENGKRYHHIIDPMTGYPVDNGLLSVTVICEDGVKADAMSTALFVMGIEGAVEFWREHSDEFGIVFYTEDGKLYITEDIKDEFRTDLEYQIIPISEEGYN